MKVWICLKGFDCLGSLEMLNTLLPSTSRLLQPIIREQMRFASRKEVEKRVIIIQHFKFLSFDFQVHGQTNEGSLLRSGSDSLLSSAKRIQTLGDGRQIEIPETK